MKIKEQITNWVAVAALVLLSPVPAAMAQIETNHVAELRPEVNDTGEIYLRKINMLQATGGVTTISRDVCKRSPAFVLAGATAQDYVYFVATNEVFSVTNGYGWLNSILLLSPTNGTVNLFVSAGPPESSTIGFPWSFNLNGNFATNQFGASRTINLTTKQGAYWSGGDSGIGYPIYGNRYVYVVGTWGSATTASHAATSTGTNISVTLGCIDDSTR